MTIDESEIHRLARYREIAHVNAYGCSMRGTQQVHSAECNNVVAALAREYASALAAEREQHARDVADARAETWREAAGIVNEHAERWRNRPAREPNSLGLAIAFSDRARDAAAALPARTESATAEARIMDQVDRWAAALRRAHWWEDDTLKPWDEFVRLSNENDGSDAELWRRLARAALREFDNDPDDATAPPPSPASPTTPLTPCPKCGAEWVVFAGGEDAGMVHGPGCPDQRAPASPTGETRDEVNTADPYGFAFKRARCGHVAYRNHDDMCIDDDCRDAAYQVVARLGEPASAPGGAPGVETACGSCGNAVTSGDAVDAGNGMVFCSGRCYGATVGVPVAESSQADIAAAWLQKARVCASVGCTHFPLEESDRCAEPDGTGTAPTPSTETPTGGR